jgi:hypothetical protein
MLRKVEKLVPFKVRHKILGTIHTVYQVKCDERRINSFYFLIYQDNEWLYTHASYFEPYSTEIEAI